MIIEFPLKRERLGDQILEDIIRYILEISVVRM